MSPLRTRLALEALVALAVVAFFRMSAASAASVNFSPASPFLLSSEGEGDLQFLLSQERAISNRFEEEFHVEIIQYFSEREVEEATKVEYTSIPQPIIYTSQFLQQGVNCSSLQSELHENYIDPEVVLYPEWIYDSKLIGDCPTQYVTRELPPEYSPAIVLEAVCACGGSQCSQKGHQCVPLSLHVPVWVRRAPNLHVLDVEEVTVACACAMRPSFHGDFIFSAAIQS